MDYPYALIFCTFFALIGWICWLSHKDRAAYLSESPDPRRHLRPVDIHSHQFFAQGYFHRFTDTHAIVEGMDGTVMKYPLQNYNLKFTDRGEEVT